MDAQKIAENVVRTCLQLDETVELKSETYLMGNFAEFNSLTITTMIAEIEDVTGCGIDDDELSAELFETVGSLAEFVQMKLDQG